MLPFDRGRRNLDAGLDPDLDCCAHMRTPICDGQDLMFRHSTTRLHSLHHIDVQVNKVDPKFGAQGLMVVSCDGLPFELLGSALLSILKHHARESESFRLSIKFLD